MPLNLRIDPILCKGHALCAELLPEAITLDEWGYPILSPVPDDLRALARRAVTDCPVLALTLTQGQAGRDADTRRQRRLSEQ